MPISSSFGVDTIILEKTFCGMSQGERVRPICPIATLFVAFNVLYLTSRTVPYCLKGYNFYHSLMSSPLRATWRHWSRGHKTRSRWFPI